MKVCIVCPGWPGKVNHWNGIFIQEQANSLIKAGCDVSIVTAQVFKEDPLFELDGKIKIYRFWFPSKRKLLAEYSKIPAIRIGIYLLTGTLRTLRVIRKERPNIIHAHWAIPSGLIGVIVGKLLRKKVIITVHDSDVTTFPSRSKIAKSLISYALNQASYIVPTNSTLEEIVKKNFNIPKEKISVIPLGIDKELFKPFNKETARSSLDLPKNKKIILFIGALLKIKGVDYLVESMPQIIKANKDAVFLFVGEGPLQKKLKERIDSLGYSSKVQFVGSKPYKEIPLWLNASDVLVLPTLSKGLGMVVIEAISTGTPIVSSPVGAAKKLVLEGVNGFTVEPGQSVKIAEKVNTILENIDTFRTKPNEHSQAFNNEVIAKEIIALYLRVCKKKVTILCPGWPGKVNQWNGIFIQEQARNLSNEGCDVSVITARIFKEDPLTEQDGKIKIYRFRFPSQQKLLVEYKKIPFIRITLYLISGIIKSFRVIRKERSDIIHAHWAVPMGLISVIVGKYLLRKPVVLTVHDSDITTLPEQSSIARYLINLTLTKVNTIISISKELEKVVTNDFNVNPNKVHFIPLGIDKTLFKPIDKKEARQQLSLPQNKTIFLFIGGLLEIKGIKYLMKSIPKVVKQNPNVLFLLIGSGPLKGMLVNLIQELKLQNNIILCNSMPHEEIPLWIGSCDVLMLPSLSESFGLVISEALAMKKPVIATKVGAIPTIVKNNYNGILINPKDSKAIESAINQIINNPNLLNTLTKNADLDDKYHNKFRVSEVIQTYKDI